MGLIEEGVRTRMLRKGVRSSESVLDPFVKKYCEAAASLRGMRIFGRQRSISCGTRKTPR